MKDKGRTASLWFDFGNVIAFFDHRRACIELSKLSEGLDSEEIYRRVFESGLEDRYDRGAISTSEFLETLRAELHLCGNDEEIKRAWSDIFWPNEAVTSVIPKLHGAGLKIVLASNTNQMHCDWFRERFADTLQYFDGQVVSHEVGWRKPDREFFECCLRAAGCPPDECLYFDDRADLIEAAAELGIPGLIYTPELDLSEELRARGVKF